MPGVTTWAGWASRDRATGPGRARGNRTWLRPAGVAVVSLALLVPASLPVHAGPAASEVSVERRPVPYGPVDLDIDTGGAPVDSLEDYVPGTLRVDGDEHPMEIRGRGNSTWRWPKKPYKIKLGDDAGLLGMPADDEWVLLANYADRSALRTQLAFDLASRTRLAWTPRTRYVDVELNGESLGLYTLTEQVEQGANRVDLPDDGYLLEIDKRFRRNGEIGFWTRHGVPISFKDPDELTARQRREVRTAARRLEAALYSGHFAHRRTGYRRLVDVGSFVDWYLVEEFFRNQDSNFQTSVNLTWTPGGRFAMGPVWDFDLSAGTKWRDTTGPRGWLTRNGRHWLTRMLEDPAFSARVKKRWATLRPRVEEVIAQIPASADAIRLSANQDRSLWPVEDSPIPWSVHADTFGGEVAFLRRWMDDRVEWLSRPEVGFARTGWTVEERSRTVRVPVRVLAPQGKRVSVRYAWKSGTATRGKDFDVTDGRLVFRPGDRTESFRVRIHQDRRTEKGESINLRLSGVSDNAILGLPSRVRLRIAASDRRPD
jgi:hypothetical protein